MLQKIFSEKLILFITIVVSVAAAYVSYTNNVMVAYNDAAAHLNTSRRIIDNLTPGIVQIGSVWLPLLHLAQIPFVANFFLWKSGIAGYLVSGISFVIASYYLYKLAYFFTNKKLASFAAVFVFISSLNLLYLQTTAMFEPMLMATAIPASYFLTRWLKEFELKHLILAALFIMLASLTRYDGWALFASSSVVVIFGSFFSKVKRGREGPALLFLFLAVFGILLWFLYNQLIFSDPLYFARSEYSARAQQEILEERGQLPTKGDVATSLFTYSLAVVVNNGLIICALFLLGFLTFLFKEHRKLFALGPLLLVVPFLFNVFSLFQGQSVIWMPMIPPYFTTYFNARYGLLMLPGLAFFAGYLVGKSKFLFAVVVLGIAAQLYLFLNPSVLPIMGHKIGIITLQDTVSSINPDTLSASKFLSERHTEGELILASSASADAFIYRTGVPLRHFITEGTGYYWKNSLRTPNQYASWAVFFNDESDRVGKVIGKDKYFKEQFTKVYTNNTYQIWRAKPKKQ